MTIQFSNVFPFLLAMVGAAGHDGTGAVPVEDAVILIDGECLVCIGQRVDCQTDRVLQGVLGGLAAG